VTELYGLFFEYLEQGEHAVDGLIRICDKADSHGARFTRQFYFHRNRSDLVRYLDQMRAAREGTDKIFKALRR